MRSLQNTSWPVTSAAAQRYIVTPPPSPPSRNDSSSIATRGAAAEVLLDDALQMLPWLTRGLDVNVLALALFYVQ